MNADDFLLENIQSVNDKKPYPHVIVFFKDAAIKQEAFNAATKIKNALKIGKSNCLIQQDNAFIRIPPSKIKRLSEFKEIVEKESFFGVPYTYRYEEAE